MTPVRLEPAALRSRVKHSTTEPLRSLNFICGTSEYCWVFLLFSVALGVAKLTPLIGFIVSMFPASFARSRKNRDILSYHFICGINMEKIKRIFCFYFPLDLVFESYHPFDIFVFKFSL